MVGFLMNVPVISFVNDISNKETVLARNENRWEKSDCCMLLLISQKKSFFFCISRVIRWLTGLCDRSPAWFAIISLFCHCLQNYRKKYGQRRSQKRVSIQKKKEFFFISNSKWCIECMYAYNWACCRFLFTFFSWLLFEIEMNVILFNGMQLIWI